MVKAHYLPHTQKAVSDRNKLSNTWGEWMFFIVFFIREREREKKKIESSLLWHFPVCLSKEWPWNYGQRQYDGQLLGRRRRQYSDRQHYMISIGPCLLFGNLFYYFCPDETTSGALHDSLFIDDDDVVTKENEIQRLQGLLSIRLPFTVSKKTHVNILTTTSALRHRAAPSLSPAAAAVNTFTPWDIRAGAPQEPSRWKEDVTDGSIVTQGDPQSHRRDPTRSGPSVITFIAFFYTRYILIRGSSKEMKLTQRYLVSSPAFGW